MRNEDQAFGIQSKVYDEIEQYARSKMAGKLKDKYAPKPAPVDEAAPEAVDDDELDQESLSRLAAMAGE